jgi:hypothetical protein
MGRPRFTIRIPCMTSALANFACHSRVERSGASSLLEERRIGFLFPFIGFPHADDAARAASWRPDNNHHSLVPQTDRYEAWLTVIIPCILHRHMNIVENAAAPFKIQSASRQRPVTLCRIICDDHGINVTTLKRICKQRLFPCMGSKRTAGKSALVSDGRHGFSNRLTALNLAPLIG